MPKQALESLTETMFYVLLALYQEEKCGTDIAVWIEKTTKVRLRPGPATLYTILAKFEKEKLIRETKVEGCKRTYAITEHGRQCCRNEWDRLRQCVRDGEEQLSGKEA